MSTPSTVTLPLYNFSTGKEEGKKELDARVFAAKISRSAVHQVVVSLASNRRKSTAHTKTKAEVSGGGKKPWKQKGTGRARQGSTRNPQWRGGGKAHGPRNEKNYEMKINKSMMRAALKSVLSDRANTGLVLVNDFALESIQTKTAMQKLSALPMPDTSTLLIVSESNPILVKSIRNLPRVSMVRALDVGVEQLLRHKRIIMASTAADQLTERLLSTKA